MSSTALSFPVQDKPSHFLHDLPLEVRLYIYRFVLILQKPILLSTLKSKSAGESSSWVSEYGHKPRVYAGHWRRFKCLGLLLSCKQIYNEAVDVLYRENWFFTGGDHYDPAKLWSGFVNVEKIRKLQFCIIAADLDLEIRKEEEENLQAWGSVLGQLTHVELFGNKVAATPQERQLWDDWWGWVLVVLKKERLRDGDRSYFKVYSGYQVCWQAWRDTEERGWKYYLLREKEEEASKKGKRRRQEDEVVG